MYWNITDIPIPSGLSAININMRCIEMCDTGDLILFDED